MTISRVNLVNCRNHKEINLNFSKDINIIIGNNGTGKTSILEAISLVSTLRSPRGSLINQIITNEENMMVIEAEIINKNGEKTIRLVCYKNGEKKISINGRELKKATELLGIFKTVFLSLDDISLVNGSPQNRRRFLDIILMQSSNTYKDNLNNYIEVLRQKNRLIKEIIESEAKKEELDIWDERIAFYGAKIIDERYKIINNIKWLIKGMYDKLYGNKETLNVSYFSSISFKNEGLEEVKKIENAYEKLLQQIQLNRQKELKLGMAIIGPHRDDIQIKINNNKVTGYASTGQERSILISFKMAEIEYFKKIDGEYPVILVDDCFVELDKERKKIIWNEIENKTQVILVSTDKREYAGEKKDLFMYELLDTRREKICTN